jgi:maltooligosyltrehalose trehalohydrolase
MGEEWGAGTPWQYFTDHTNEEIGKAVQRGRKAEFATHGWNSEDVPDPQDPATVERSRLDWSERDAEPHARLLGWYRDLIRLRRTVPDLSGGWVGEPSVEYDESARTVLVARGEHRVLANLSDTDQKLHVPDGGAVLLAWDPETYVDADGTVTVPAESAVVTGPDPVGPAATLEQ